ncbi:ArgP/LysG family DNA-binding transcriptional regulator [Chitinibacter bivalviorum]|uniref:ArgP/LysG family DNA-binding transcriptional regulator n=1 Tax=Chitinibacter bivalviorum TaxID=2739434 RepID=A0A7H9BFI4_9NEIS|nr:ArgP/LysG family DNA-binding transcriptional regulator [Chitinibacter bivalviorum]QLG87335.1 ArgP/LysG family DNA-binding transcriptional regulator [Chitinibacter bivalviorum]
MFDYKLLEALDMVLRCGSFDAAAKRLHLTPSAISQRIRQLEERHGEVLLRRENPICATPSGEKLLAHVRQVRALEAELGEQLAEDLDEQGATQAWRTLRIGVNADSLALGLMPALSGLLSAQRLLLECVVDDEAYTLDLLRTGEVSGCISTQSNLVAGCGVLPLGSMQYIGVASPQFAALHLGEKLDAERLGNAPAAVFGYKESLHRRLLRERWGLLEGQYPCHVIPESNALFAAALAGFAYAVVPRQQAQVALASGELVEIAAFSHEVPLFWHHWSRQTRPAQLFSQALMSFASTHLGPSNI